MASIIRTKLKLLVFERLLNTFWNITSVTRIPYSGKVWQGKSLANLANRP